MNLKSKFSAFTTGLMLAVVSTASMAAPADVTAVTAAIADAGPPIAAIGGAVLVVLVGVKVYKWITRAL